MQAIVLLLFSADMFAIADTSYFRSNGQSSYRVARNIQQMVHLANKTFSKTLFTKNGINVGSPNEPTYTFHLALANMIILNESHLYDNSEDDQYGEKYKFNQVRTWNEEDLHKAIAELPSDLIDGYCAVIVFTANKVLRSNRMFINGSAHELGLMRNGENIAIVATSEGRIDQSGAESLHQPRVDLNDVLVLLHELGHLWSAPHDTDSELCMPNNGEGTFLMDLGIRSVGPNNFVSFLCDLF